MLSYIHAFGMGSFSPVFRHQEEKCIGPTLLFGYSNACLAFASARTKVPLEQFTVLDKTRFRFLCDSL